MRNSSLIYDLTPTSNSPSISILVKSHENSSRTFKLPSSSYQDQALASLAISPISHFISAFIIKTNLRESITIIKYILRRSLETAS
jgi:di/tricarboxylate transporter